MRQSSGSLNSSFDATDENQLVFVEELLFSALQENNITKVLRGICLQILARMMNVEAEMERKQFFSIRMIYVTTEEIKRKN